MKILIRNLKCSFQALKESFLNIFKIKNDRLKQLFPKTDLQKRHIKFNPPKTNRCCLNFMHDYHLLVPPLRVFSRFAAPQLISNRAFEVEGFGTLLSAAHSNNNKLRQ